MRETLRLTKEDASEVISDNLEGYTLILDEIYHKGRWHTDREIVIQRNADSKFFRSHYSCGSTEIQDHTPWEYEEPDFTEVFTKEKTVIVYE